VQVSAEENFYADKNGVRINAARAVFGSITYPIADITSVNISKEPAKRKPGILVAIAGIVLFTIGLRIDEVWLAFAGFIILALGALITHATKSSYHLIITSASGEANPISSLDKEYIEKIVVVINEVMTKPE
jgi:hypothetical protein